MNEMTTYDDRDTLIAGLREQLRVCQADLTAERQKNTGVDQGVAELRRSLTPLYRALQSVFGEMDAMGIQVDVAPAQVVGSPKSSAAWESWKSKLGGYSAKAIDALLLHGALTQTQLRIHIGCATSSVPGVVSTLWKAGLLNKSGGKISLKEL